MKFTIVLSIRLAVITPVKNLDLLIINVILNDNNTVATLADRAHFYFANAQIFSGKMCDFYINLID